MKKSDNADKKIRLTDKSIVAIIIQQIVSLLAVTIFYAVKLNDVEIAVPVIVAVLSAILFAVGIILTICFNRFYMRKQIPNYAKKKIETEQDSKVSIFVRNNFQVGLAISMINFLFNLMLFGAMAFIK